MIAKFQKKISTGTQNCGQSHNIQYIKLKENSNQNGKSGFDRYFDCLVRFFSSEFLWNFAVMKIPFD